MELWKRTFDDSDEFVRFYFDRKYSDYDSLLCEENGKALSALLMLPYPMSWNGTCLSASYISGACTLTEARNRGLMTRLLREAFAGMNRQHIALSILIPAEEWLFQYYSKLGYAAVFDYSGEQYSPGDAVSGVKTICPENYEKEWITGLFPYFDTKMQERPCCVQHPLLDYTAIAEDIYLSGGRILATYADPAAPVTGMALVVPEEKHILVKEMFYDSPIEKEALLQNIVRIWKRPKIYYKALPRQLNARHYGMARVTDALLMLQHTASIHPTTSLAIQVNDPLLAANDGIYSLSKGQCTKVTGVRPDIETDIPTLTKALLGYHTELLPQFPPEIFRSQQPYMNLMID